MTPEKRVATAMRDAQLVLSAYVEPGFHDPQQTINELFSVLDDYQLIQALEEIENRQSAETGQKSEKSERRLRGAALDKAPWG